MVFERTLAAETDASTGLDPTPLAGVSKRGRPARWLARRLGLGLATLVVVSVVIFIVTHVLPSDPARAILGQFAEPVQLQAVTRELGLNKPVVSQYFSWIGNVVQGNFGVSFATKAPVLSLIGPRLENSMTLIGVVILIAIPISASLGVLAAMRRDRLVDNVVSMFTIGTSGIPEFVIGILLSLFFATTLLHLVPAIDVTPPGENPLVAPKGMILPVATLVIAVIPYLTRLVRGSMIEVLESPYVEMARLKGMPERYVVRSHALRNAIVPAIQGTALSLIYLLGNVVVVEYLFNYPGMGEALASAVSTRDLPMIQGLGLVFAAMFVLFNIVADLLTVYATPRLRTELLG
jgi:peptide/nickel transport system permease protein